MPASLGPLTPSEQRVIQRLRALGQQSPEWKLVIARHDRQRQSYWQLEATVFSKHMVGPDAFVAVD